MRRVIIVFVLALLVGCATRGPGSSAYIPGPSVYIPMAEEALARGDDILAFANYAYAIDSANQPASEAALATVRASPRLLTAMDAAIEQIQNSTAVGNVTRDEYVRDLSRRAEVRTLFKIRQLDARQQEQFFQSAWAKASVFAEQARAEAQRREAEELVAVARGSRVTCANEVECRKAFSLAQIFVSTKTDMKIQLATDTIIETYNPTEAGKMGAKVIKTPGAGQSAEIVITVTCRECSLPLRRSSYDLMKEFRPFVDARLRQ